MTDQTHNTKNKELLLGITASFLVIICTFPENDWAFSVGIDPPKAWVYNTLFENSLDLGKHIIFPHGPLAFFMYPLKENILLTSIVVALLKLSIVFNIFCLRPDLNYYIKWTAAFLVAYLFSTLAEFNHLVLANLILLYCNYYRSNKRVYKLIAFFITGFVFFVKAYVAIVSGMIFLSFTLYYLYSSKNIKPFLIDCLTLFGFIFLFWLFMYRTSNGFLSYLWGMFHLAQDNSSAASYYPYNNWLVLSAFLFLLLILIVSNRTKESIFFGLLTCLSLFAAWKHGMAREDAYHMYGLFIYVTICLIIFILFNKKKLLYNTLISISALYLISVNIKNSVNYFPLEFKLFKAGNFTEFIFHFPRLEKEMEIKSQNEIAGNRLSKKTLQLIAHATVDVYPWDYSIIAANNLQWQPRVVLHSYASYTSWLDKKNADHFDSEKAPDFLIIEENTWSNINGGEYNSIDGRYFLNDEPQTILSILQNYEHFIQENKFLILKKRKTPLIISSKDIGTNASSWDKWISVPKNNGDLLRVRLTFNTTLTQRIKSFIYKDEQFWIYLKLKNGALHKYRIVTKNAADGLWINPYVVSSDKIEEVEKIMFRSSNRAILTDNIRITWEQFQFKNTSEIIENFFITGYNRQDSLLFYSLNDYETTNKKYWNDLTKEQFSSISFSGKSSYLLKAKSFSSTLSFPLDSIPFQTLSIAAEGWLKATHYKLSNELTMVISIAKEKDNLLWKSTSMDGQLIDQSQWNHLFNFQQYKHDTKNCILIVYLWNGSEKDVYLDDFSIRITKPYHP